MEERDPAGAGSCAQPDRVLGGRVAEGGLGRDLLRAEVGVVDQEIDVARQLERRVVVFAPAVGPGPSAVGQWSGM